MQQEGGREQQTMVLLAPTTHRMLPPCLIFLQLELVGGEKTPAWDGWLVLGEVCCATSCQHSPPTASSALSTGLSKSCCNKWLPTAHLAPSGIRVGFLGSVSTPLKPVFSFLSHRG